MPAATDPARACATAALLACAPMALAQATDVLDDVGVGVARVRLAVFAQGMGGPLEAINSDGPDGTNFVTSLSPLPDGSGRTLALTLGGRLWLIDAAGRRTLFHDAVDPDVTEINPRFFGPVAILAHPGFAANGRFYTIETELEGTARADFGTGDDHQDVLYEYDMDDPSAMRLADTPFTKRAVLRIDQPARDHNMNDLAFLPDGTLLVAVGDGANSSGGGASPPQLRAADAGSALGKILRIDPEGDSGASGRYAIPADNPFVGLPGAVEEVYSLGHRNPFRIAVDPGTGEVWAGEVGQRNVEEVNRILPGTNYGWPRKEGSFLFGREAGDANGDGVIDDRDIAPDPDTDGNGTGDRADTLGLADPILEYDRGTGRSIAGGFVYRGSAIPALAGRYLLGDTIPASVGVMMHGGPASGPAAGSIGDLAALAFADAGAPAPPGIVGLRPDHDGEPLAMTTDGRILRLTAPGCRPDLDGDGELTLFDFLAFQNLFDAGDLAADFDGDGELTIFDFLAFQNAFDAGCA